MKKWNRNRRILMKIGDISVWIRNRLMWGGIGVEWYQKRDPGWWIQTDESHGWFFAYQMSNVGGRRFVNETNRTRSLWPGNKQLFLVFRKLIYSPNTCWRLMVELSKVKKSSTIISCDIFFSLFSHCWKRLIFRFILYGNSRKDTCTLKRGNLQRVAQVDK